MTESIEDNILEMPRPELTIDNAENIAGVDDGNTKREKIWQGRGEEVLQNPETSLKQREVEKFDAEEAQKYLSKFVDDDGQKIKGKSKGELRAAKDFLDSNGFASSDLNDLVAGKRDKRFDF